MHKYEWGGYTKLSGRAWFLEENRGNANVYSKYVRKRWTLDASAGGTLAYGNQARGHNEEIYRDIMFRGNHYDELRRITHIDDAYTHSNNEWGSLRLSYSSDSLYIQHQAGFSRYAEPGNMTRTSLSFSDAVVGDNLMSERRSDSQNLSPWVSGYYWISMPRGNTLNISWNFSYGSRRSHNNYAVNGMEPILNSNREKYYSPTANLTYSKQLGHGNTFRTSLVSYNTIYHTDYYGSYDGRQSLLSSENMLFLEYMQNWKCGLNLFSRVGMSYVIGRVNSHTNLKQWNPRLGLQLQYKINDRHSASIEGWWGNSHPGASTSNTALVQSNELLWLQGNTRLRNTIFRQATASYSFIPNNRYSLSASVEWKGKGNKQAYDYFVLPGYDGVVRRTINSGNANRYTASLNGTASFFDSRLRINVYASANHVRLTGIDRQHCNWIVGQAISVVLLRQLRHQHALLHPTEVDRCLQRWHSAKLSEHLRVLCQLHGGQFQVLHQHPQLVQQRGAYPQQLRGHAPLCREGLDQRRLQSEHLLQRHLHLQLRQEGADGQRASEPRWRQVGHSAITLNPNKLNRPCQRK